MLDSLGANVAAFDLEDVAGGVWSRMRYNSLTLHHPASMMQLPQFPVPDSYPKYLSTFEVATYLASAVEALKLPVFSGIKVISNTFDEATDLWQVRIRDVETESEAILEAKNVVLSNGFLLGPNYPNLPDLSDRHLFRGPVQHTAEYRTAQPYQAKDVVVVGSGNSAHDVARGLALGGAKSVTILQRSPTPLFDFHVVSPMIEANYQGHIPVDTADFLDNVLPLAVKRDLYRGAMARIIQSQAERYAALESKG
jgi:putative flavoprotein involved in K+ transport